MVYSIYVIELKKEVLKHRKFKEANPNYIPGKPCVYVGYTSKTPEERYQQHQGAQPGTFDSSRYKPCENWIL